MQHVFAAGDGAEATDLSTGKNDVLAIQPIAVEHGRIAGQNMAGVRTAFEGGLNMNVLDTLGLVSSSFGLWQGAKLGTSGRATDEAKFRYLRLEFEGERLVGGQAVGRTDHIGILRGLIQTRLKLGAWRQRLIAAPERLTEAYVAVAHGHPSAGWTKPHVNVPA